MCHECLRQSSFPNKNVIISVLGLTEQRKTIVSQLCKNTVTKTDDVLHETSAGTVVAWSVSMASRLCVYSRDVRQKRMTYISVWIGRANDLNVRLIYARFPDLFIRILGEKTLKYMCEYVEILHQQKGVSLHSIQVVGFLSAVPVQAPLLV